MGCTVSRGDVIKANPNPHNKKNLEQGFTLTAIFFVTLLDLKVTASDLVGSRKGRITDNYQFLQTLGVGI